MCANRSLVSVHSRADVLRIILNKYGLMARDDRVLVLALALIFFQIASEAIHARPISDADFFESRPHTLITFENRGDGSPVPHNDADFFSLEMPFDEYASQGFIFNPSISWGDDGNPDFKTAQAIGGSPRIGIPITNTDFEIRFSNPIRSFGF